MKIAKTTYHVTVGQQLHGSPLAEGQLLAELRHPPEIPASHVIEAMRGGIPTLKVKTSVIEEVPGADESNKQNKQDGATPKGNAGGKGNNKPAEGSA